MKILVLSRELLGCFVTERTVSPSFIVVAAVLLDQGARFEQRAAGCGFAILLRAGRRKGAAVA